ncbi:MAG: LamG domain-containing protein [Ignavibacteria bacterium]|nr:LamG domain-containing protein [Ignavibacteria bacterium]
MIEPNTWYHVNGVFNSATGEHSIYINGVLDTTSTYSSTLPASNTDSLFIGISGNSSPFNGMLDE